MEKVAIEQIVRDERDLQIDPATSDHITYPEFVKYFADLEVIKLHNLIIGANFTYGWMPTMLKFKSNDFGSSVAILNKAKHGDLITEAELVTLRDFINNSVVGTSKLLHFVAPSVYAIWDSRVYRYINERDHYGDMIKPQNYFAYIENCTELVQHRDFPRVHDSMKRKLGYSVSPLRSVELVMHLKGGR